MIDLLDRARRLPEGHPLRVLLIIDVEQLGAAKAWLNVQRDAPKAAVHMLTLAEAHLRSRLIRAEERIGEHIRVPA